jgi:hypothetical protein
LDAIADLRAFGAAAGDYLTAMLETGASLGEVRGQAALFRAELEAQLRQAGLSEEAIKQYVEAAMLAPDQIETAIKLSGAEQARFKLNAYLGLLEGKIPPEVATQVIAQIESGNLDAAASTLKNFAATNPVDIDLTPKGVDKIDEASGKITDLPRKYDPLIAATGGYTDANLDALDAVLSLGDAYQGTLAQLASEDPQKAITYAEQMREQFANVVAGLGLTKEELESYYELLGIAEPQVETAIKISINEAELFALTTTIDLLTDLDSLSPEVTLQLSDALLRNDYEEVRRLLESEVSATLSADGQRALATFFAFEQYVTTADPTTTIGANDEPARLRFGFLLRDISAARPELQLTLRVSALADAFPIFGTAGSPGTAGLDGLAGFNPGGLDGDPRTPFRTGGFVRGRGTSISDDIPASLSNGEYVVQASAVDRIGVPTLEAINNGMMPTASVGSDKGQAALMDTLRQLAARIADMGGDTVNIYETQSARQTAEELFRVRSANRFLAGR